MYYIIGKHNFQAKSRLEKAFGGGKLPPIHLFETLEFSTVVKAEDNVSIKRITKDKHITFR